MPRLPPTTTELIIQLHYEGLSPTEIAYRSHVSISTAYGLINNLDTGGTGYFTRYGTKEHVAQVALSSSESPISNLSVRDRAFIIAARERLAAIGKNAYWLAAKTHYTRQTISLLLQEEFVPRDELKTAIVGVLFPELQQFRNLRVSILGPVSGVSRNVIERLQLAEQRLEGQGFDGGFFYYAAKQYLVYGVSLNALQEEFGLHGHEPYLGTIFDYLRIPRLSRVEAQRRDLTLRQKDPEFRRKIIAAIHLNWQNSQVVENVNASRRTRLYGAPISRKDVIRVIKTYDEVVQHVQTEEDLVARIGGITGIRAEDVTVVINHFILGEGKLSRFNMSALKKPKDEIEIQKEVQKRRINFLNYLRSNPHVTHHDIRDAGYRGILETSYEGRITDAKLAAGLDLFFIRMPSMGPQSQINRVNLMQRKREAFLKWLRINPDSTTRQARAFHPYALRQIYKFKIEDAQRDAGVPILDGDERRRRARRMHEAITAQVFT